jgi:hypothetical protein
VALLAAAACERPMPGDPEVREVRAAVPAAVPTFDAPSVAASAPGTAANPAAQMCPPMSFVTGINLAKNPSFEVGTGPKSWPPGPTPPVSAATGWVMHTDNIGTTVSTARVSTTVPGPGGAKMLNVRAGGNEGGVYQYIPTAPNKVMFSVWVYVTKGQVQIGANATTPLSPYSHSTKIGEWEQLRVCTDGTYPTQYFYIYNQAAGGGSFVADRVEIKETP